MFWSLTEIGIRGWVSTVWSPYLFIHLLTIIDWVSSKMLSTLPGISDAGMSGILPLKVQFLVEKFGWGTGSEDYTRVLKALDLIPSTTTMSRKRQEKRRRERERKEVTNHRIYSSCLSRSRAGLEAKNKTAAIVRILNVLLKIFCWWLGSSPWYCKEVVEHFGPGVQWERGR